MNLSIKRSRLTDIDNRLWLSDGEGKRQGETGSLRLVDASTIFNMDK